MAQFQCPNSYLKGVRSKIVGELFSDFCVRLLGVGAFDGGVCDLVLLAATSWEKGIP